MGDVITRLSWLLLLAVVLTGCPPCDSGYPELFHDRLEQVCGSLPCHWELLEGRAAFVTTWHAGEHAIELSDGGVVGRDLPRVFVTGDDGFMLSAGIECTGSASLLFRAEVDFGQGGPLVLFSGGGPSIVGGADGDGIIEPRRVPLIGQQAEMPDNMPPSFTIERIEIELTGAGSCLVDDVRVLSNNNYSCET